MSQGEKILLVEDNDFVRMQMKTYLQDAGYKVIEAINGAAALAQITNDISLIVVDVRMAPVDGFELIKAVRGRNPTLPMILVTGDQNPDLLNEAGKWSVSAVLMKPVHRDRLVSMSERAIAKVKKK
jgi:two-component system OmpR family response regulator